MNNPYECRIPQKNPQDSIRLFSDEGVIYFASGFFPSFGSMDKEMLNKIDPAHRILAHMLVQRGAKIITCFHSEGMERDELETLWNRIKRNEKDIRKNGLKLNMMDGKSFTYQHKTYTVFWPSLEAFIIEYPKECISSWFVFDAPKDEIFTGVLVDRKDLFDGNMKSEIRPDGMVRFSISSEKPISVFDWRRYTQTIAEIINIPAEVQS